MGFGDIVVPNPLPMTYPVILEMEAPILLAYSIESSIAEKFEAMIDLGETNTRMKDYYDVYQLIKNEVIDDQFLEQAISATFGNRQTAALADHSLFSQLFYKDELRISRWKAWLRQTI